METRAGDPGAFARFDLSRVPSPCFVVDEAAVRRNLAILKDVGDRSGARVLLALKAFSMWAMADLIGENLDGVCASGLWEARLAREHYRGELTTYSPAYRRDDLPELLRLSDTVIFNSPAQLARFAADLARNGVRRINVSLDTLDPDTFRAVTRGGDLAQVIAGIDAAQAAGLKVKINAVALARDHRADLPALLAWAHGRGCDLTLIETMPMGEVDEDRTDQYVSLTDLRADMAAVWTLDPLDEDSGGPARYFRVAETGGKLGLITPMSHNFCDTCNRVRLTCTGTLHTCLGQDDATDLRAVMRAAPEDDAALVEAIRGAIAAKPKGHDFRIGRGEGPAVARHMSTTGG